MGESITLFRKRRSDEVHSETKDSKDICKRRNELGASDHDSFANNESAKGIKPSNTAGFENQNPFTRASTIQGFAPRLSNQVSSRADMQSAITLPDVEDRAMRSVELVTPQLLNEILKERKKELFIINSAVEAKYTKKGRLITVIPLIEPFVASNGFPGDLAVRKNGKASPYFGNGKRKGLLDHVGQGEDSTFIEALKAGIVTKSFSDDTAKELYAITLLEGMRVQYAYTRFSDALGRAKSDREFITLFKKIPYTKSGGAKLMREERVHVNGEETDSEEAPHWNKIFTAKKNQLDEAELKVNKTKARLPLG